MLALTAASLCAMLERRTPADAIKKAGIKSSDVLAFHVGSMLTFGMFFFLVMVVIIGNGMVEEPFRWSELVEGTEAMLLVAGIGLSFDLWHANRLTVDEVQARVNACNVRWGLFWLLGFAGTGVMVLTGRPALFFGFFAALKIGLESMSRLSRAFGGQRQSSPA